MLTYVTKNSAGGGPHPEEFITWIRAKRAFDLAVLLPDGRLAFFTFNGEAVSTGFARKELGRRFGQQFYNQNLSFASCAPVRNVGCRSQTRTSCSHQGRTLPWWHCPLTTRMRLA